MASSPASSISADSGCTGLDMVVKAAPNSTAPSACARTIEQKRVTYDFERQMAGATLLKTSEFAEAIVGNI